MFARVHASAIAFHCRPHKYVHTQVRLIENQFTIDEDTETVAQHYRKL